MARVSDVSPRIRVQLQGFFRGFRVFGGLGFFGGFRAFWGLGFLGGLGLRVFWVFRVFWDRVQGFRVFWGLGFFGFMVFWGFRVKGFLGV